MEGDVGARVEMRFVNKLVGAVLTVIAGRQTDRWMASLARPYCGRSTFGSWAAFGMLRRQQHATSCRYRASTLLTRNLLEHADIPHH